MASLALSTRLTSEKSEVGVNLIPSIAYYPRRHRRPFDYMDYVDALDKLDEWNQQGLYAEGRLRLAAGASTTAL